MHLLARRVLAPSAFALGAAACGTDTSTSATSNPARFTETFRAEAYFNAARVRFAPNNRLVIVEGTERELIVLDETGNEVSKWRSTPDLAARGPTIFDVSSDGLVAVDDPTGRINTFTLDGERIGTFEARGMAVLGLAFDGAGNLLAETRGNSIQSLTEGSTRELMRWPGGEVLWTSPMLPRRLGGTRPFPPLPVFGHVGPRAVAVGMREAYDLAVLDTESAAQVGQITRDVPLRGPDDAYRDNLSNLFRREGLLEGEREIEFPVTLPAVRYVFTGPPNGTIWVRRGLGVDDAHSPPITVMSAAPFRLYDLFEPDTYEYLGTVEAPDRVTLMDGTDALVAGVVRGPFDARIPVVYRVDLEG